MVFRIFRHAAAFAGCLLGLAAPLAHAEGSAAPAPSPVPSSTR